MNIITITELLSKYPFDLREQIISYVRSVKYALPEILSDMNINYNAELENKVLTIAFIKKFYSITSTFYWSIDNSIASLSKDNINSIKIGGTIYSRDSREYYLLRVLFDELNHFMIDNNLMDYINTARYSDIIEMINNE